jgi:nucleoside-diphosphate-sugar epimerase
MHKVLVTGGAGFIGSHLVTRLIEAGHRVRVLDDFSSGRMANLAHVAELYELVEGDIRDSDTCQAACDGVDFVFHQAAIGSVPKSIDDPRPSHDVNINGTFHLLRAAASHKVKRFIYAASSSAYGDTDVSPKHEDLTPNPLSPYAVQKLTGEYYCRVFSLCFGLETISLRYFNVFGDRQDPHSRYAAAIPAFASAILRAQPPTVYGDGEQSRDFTHIDNVVDANMLAMKAERTNGESVNIACGGQVTINEVIRLLNEVIGVEVKAKYVDPRPGDVRHSCADISLAAKLLGYEPRVGFKDGLERAIEYYKSFV